MNAVITPQQGTLSCDAHHFPVRVYFEDTDAGGIVYHANYLKFMERARSDFARLTGLDQRAMMAADDALTFVVRRIEIDYLRPAHLDDALIVESRLKVVAGASMTMTQRVHRDDEAMIQAEVRIAFLDAQGRAQRLPAPVRTAFEPFLIPDISSQSQKLESAP